MKIIKEFNCHIKERIFGSDLKKKTVKYNFLKMPKTLENISEIEEQRLLSKWPNMKHIIRHDDEMSNFNSKSGLLPHENVRIL